MENIYTVDTYIDMFKSCNNPFPFEFVNGSNLVKNSKSTIDLHTYVVYLHPEISFFESKKHFFDIRSKKKFL